MRVIKLNFFAVLIVPILFVVVGIVWGVEVVQAQKASSSNAGTTALRQPIYNEYRGIRLGMTTTEVRAKLGEPNLKGDDQDFYMFSDTETTQFVYDAQHKTKAISVDYMGGIGAPDPKTVVGGDLQVSSAGLYKMVRYDNLGYWVSFNRTNGPVVVVTITMQRID
jgi:hypothetical protein